MVGKNTWGEVKNSIENREAKELICMTYGHELKGGMLEGRGYRVEGGQKGEKYWDNCNSIINKIYLEINCKMITEKSFIIPK